VPTVELSLRSRRDGRFHHHCACLVCVKTPRTRATNPFRGAGAVYQHIKGANKINANIDDE